MNVSKIVLTDIEQRLFDRFRTADDVELSIDEYKILLHKKLIKDAIGGNSGWFDHLPEKGLCTLSDIGKDLRAYQIKMERAERKADRRYRITTGIAILALILSILSLAWQAYTWTSERDRSNVLADSSEAMQPE